MDKLTDVEVRELTDVLRDFGYGSLTDDFVRQQAEKLIAGEPARGVIAMFLQKPLREAGLLPVAQGEER